MNYQQTLDWLFAQLPMYQRVGKVAYKADLSNTIALMKHLHNPEKKFKSVHVGGTNGKGSVSHSLAAVFQKAGYKTGLYTSPHLKDFRERIRINGEVISEKAVTSFVAQNKGAFERLKLSFFEMTVGMAFQYFADEEVDIAIVEVGMGGRLDSTNVLTPELSIITNISLDHTQFLGNTRSAIAKEKAGIIKRGVPLVIGENDPETFDVFASKAAELEAKHYTAKVQVRAENLKNFSLKGSYQKKNLATVLRAIDVLKTQGYRLQETQDEALANVAELTGLRGRWETLSTNPTVICDTGHNEAGVKEIVSQLAECAFDKLHIVWGMVGDKDVSKILKLLPKKAIYYWCAPSIPRSLGVKQLQAYADELGLSGVCYEDPLSAKAAAEKAASKSDLIFIGGSTFTVADVLKKSHQP